MRVKKSEAINSRLRCCIFWSQINKIIYSLNEERDIRVRGGELIEKEKEKGKKREDKNESVQAYKGFMG